jgi:hypothetical protein
MNARIGLAFAFLTCAEATAFAEVDGVLVAAPAAAPSQATPRYSLPWQLRPVSNDSGVRIDSAAAGFTDANGNLEATVTTMLSASYRLTPEWAPVLRLGFVGNDAPGAALDGSSFVNPLVGATYARKRGDYQLAFHAASTLPVGTGGGNTPSLRAARANQASSTARPADDAMFAVNYLTAVAGVDVAYVNHGFTAQAEATLLQQLRVRGERSDSATDAFRTDAAVGLHLGLFIGSHVSVGSDVRYQRWLSHPTTIDALTGARVAISAAKMDSFTVAFGPRLHFPLGQHAGIHPGLSYTRGFDARGFAAPLVTAQTNALQIDVPVVF